MKSLVRAYYRVRYFPRLIVQLLTSLAAAQADGCRSSDAAQQRIDTSQQRLVASVSRVQSSQDRTERSQHLAVTALEELRHELSGVCDDTARMQISVTAVTSDLIGQLDGFARGLRQMRADVDTELRDIRALLLRLVDETANPRERHMDAVTEPIGRQQAGVARLERRTTQQSLLLPSHLWAPEIAERVQEVLALLCPVAVADVGKVRIGRDHDGGYVMLDDFTGVEAALSLGIADDVSWDEEIASRGIEVFQFDPSVAGPPTVNERFRFERLRVEAFDRPGSISLDTIVRERVGSPSGRLILKMDVEGAEWEIFDAADQPLLERFQQIVCEFHDLDRLAEQEFRSKALSVFTKLTQTHFISHVHGNNCSSFTNVGNIVFPQVLEITFALRKSFQMSENFDLFPTILDMPNQPGRADLFLGTFQFGASLALSPQKEARDSQSRVGCDSSSDTGVADQLADSGVKA